MVVLCQTVNLVPQGKHWRFDSFRRHMKYPEITCPYCRIGFGGGTPKVLHDGIVHLDIAFSQESGMSIMCEQQDYVRSQIVSIDSYQNPIFTPVYAIKLKVLQEEFLSDPSYISKDTFDSKAYFYAFLEGYNYGEICPDDKEFRPVTGKEVQNFYESGTNLYDALKSCIQ